MTASHIVPSDFSEWMKEMENRSYLFRRYGSFLPSQLKLLGRIHYAFINGRGKVITFCAPPASGKTHIIAIVSSYVQSSKCPVCIVVPNAELLKDFETELKQVNSSPIDKPNILSLSRFMRERSYYSIAFIDEAHNLRSAIEMDTSITESFDIPINFRRFASIQERLLAGSVFVSKALSTESSYDILSILAQYKEFRIRAEELKKDLTQWIGFCVSTRRFCQIKFLKANIEERSIMPNEKLLLFSATPLTKNELSFYCNVSQEDVQIMPSICPQAQRMSKIRYWWLDMEKVADKISFAISLLKRYNGQALILLNNSEACSIWNCKLKKVLKNRVYSVSSRVEPSIRSQIYHNYLSSEEGILITCSTVYWEGINIKGLRLLIIPDIPFPSPNLLEIYHGLPLSYVKVAKRRLAQGMGRIGREVEDEGICLLLFDPSRLLKLPMKATRQEILAVLRTH